MSDALRRAVCRERSRITPLGGRARHLLVAWTLLVWVTACSGAGEGSSESSASGPPPAAPTIAEGTAAAPPPLADDEAPAEAAPAAAPSGSDDCLFPRGRVRLPTELTRLPSTGVFDEHAVLRLLMARRAALSRALDPEALRDPELAGDVSVTMEISAAGTVVDAVVVPSAPNMAPVADRVTRTVRGMRFSPGPTGGSVRYSFSLVYDTIF